MKKIPENQWLDSDKCMAAGEHTAICLAHLVGVAISVCIVLPWLVVPLVPLTVWYAALSMWYRSSLRELKRLHSVARSPVFASVQEAVEGRVAIRAFRMRPLVLRRFEERLDLMVRNKRAIELCTSWQLCRISFVGALFVFATACFCVYGNDSSDLPAGEAGPSGQTVSHSNNFLETLFE